MFSKNLILTATVIALLLAIPVMAMQGSARFVVTDTVSIDGNNLKPGAYDVKWESNNTEATVNFILPGHGKALLTLKGKIEELKEKNESSSLLIAKDPSGRLVLKGLQFGGKKININF
jgi:hypothetical protein